MWSSFLTETGLFLWEIEGSAVVGGSSCPESGWQERTVWWEKAAQNGPSVSAVCCGDPAENRQSQIFTWTETDVMLNCTKICFLTQRGQFISSSGKKSRTQYCLNIWGGTFLFWTSTCCCETELICYHHETSSVHVEGCTRWRQMRGGADERKRGHTLLLVSHVWCDTSRRLDAFHMASSRS